jgi:hypothetical protein
MRHSVVFLMVCGFGCSAEPVAEPVRPPEPALVVVDAADCDGSD